MRGTNENLINALQKWILWSPYNPYHKCIAENNVQRTSQKWFKIDSIDKIFL